MPTEVHAPQAITTEFQGNRSAVCQLPQGQVTPLTTGQQAAQRVQGSTQLPLTPRT